MLNFSNLFLSNPNDMYNDCDTRIFDDTRHVCGEGGYQYLYVVPHGVVKQPRGQRVYHVCVGDGDHYVGARCAQQ